MPLTDELTNESANQDSDSNKHSLADAPIIDAFNLDNDADSSVQSQAYRLSFGRRLGYILISLLIGTAATVPFAALLIQIDLNSIKRAQTSEEELASNLLMYAMAATFFIVVSLWYSRKTKYSFITSAVSFFIAAIIPTTFWFLIYISCDVCKQYSYEYPIGTMLISWLTVTGTLTAVLSKAIDSLPKINIIWE